MYRHIAEHAITDWRSALAVAKALNVNVLYIDDRQLSGELRYGAPHQCVFGFDNNYTTHRRKDITRVVCACEGCRTAAADVFKEFDAQRKHIYAAKSCPAGALRSAPG